MFKKIVIALTAVSAPLFAADNQQLSQEIQRLQQQTKSLQAQLARLEKQMARQEPEKKQMIKIKPVAKSKPQPLIHDAPLMVHSFDGHPESLGFYPTALVADEQVITYIAGTPVVSSPYLGDRPAFDGSDYIVNISSINRDIRLMQQRRRLYDAYSRLGYPVPHMPIVAISGKVEGVAQINEPYFGPRNGNVTLGSSELDVAAALNENVEAFISAAYDDSPPALGGPAINNSRLVLNMGFVNVGNLDKTPFYFTIGQIYAPFGRYSSSMISAPLTMILARTKARPAVFGYKDQSGSGPFAAVYGFRSETTEGKSGVGGVNVGYILEGHGLHAEFGGGYLSSLNDSQGMQINGAPPVPGGIFGGFGSVVNGNEFVKKIPGANIQGNISFDRYVFTAEWVGATERFRQQDLSFNGLGAKPWAAQLEAGATFRVFDKPASVGAGYQWSQHALALGIPKQRVAGVFNMSIWKDTVESLEFRHDIDYAIGDFANGAAPVGGTNAPSLGTGRSANTLLGQISVFF